MFPKMYCFLLLFVFMELAWTESVNYIEKNEQDDAQRPAWSNFALSNDVGYPKLENEANSFYKPDTAGTMDEEFRQLNQLNDMQAMYLSNYLMKVLQNPEGSWEIPVAVVNEPNPDLDDRSYFLDANDAPVVQKRTRYYHMYPWKKKNTKYRSYNSVEYDPYTPCTPSKKDVFSLLAALHDVRNGNKSRIVEFCNRRRPASSIYTNIRFLGRKK